jgi:HAD superfamily hydrolase (TIGR01490 family)
MYARWRFARGETNALTLAKVLYWSAQYTFGIVDAAAVSRYGARTIAGRDEAAFAEECARWFHSEVLAEVAASGRAEVARRRAEGLPTAILTGSTPYAARPLAKELGIDHVIASTLEIEDGRLTGRMEEPLCFGAGKLARAERFAAEHGIDLRKSSFYTDSISDLPVLERVGEPRVVNPDPRLRRIARQRGWPIETWR